MAAATIKAESKVEENGEIEITMTIKVKFPMPSQNERLPDKLELIADAVGQQAKREMFRHAIERADQELVSSIVANDKKLKRSGKKEYRFKTIFGTMITPRSRIKNKVDGSTRIPAAYSWQTPKHVAISKALKAIVCDLVSKQSIDSTRQQLDRFVGEREMLSHGSVVNILHQQGSAIKEAVQQRMEAVFALMPEAKELLVPKRVKKYPREKEYFYDDLYVDDELVIKGSRVELYWEQGQEVQITSPLNRNDVVILQPDEVRVSGQGSTERKEVWIYTAVASSHEKTYYFSADTATELISQVGSLLAVLGVHKGERELCLLGDGARWQRNWYKDLQIANKTMVLCWYHLAERCRKLIKLAYKEDQTILLKSVISYLWFGRVAESIKLVEGAATGLKDPKSWKTIIGYLKNRWHYIPNYNERRKANFWIANTRVEKLNEWCIATRCKEKGRTWAYAGAGAIAALEVARRNGELDYWRSENKLPAWQQTGAQAMET
jgi:hypothetical protein